MITLIFEEVKRGLFKPEFIKRKDLQIYQKGIINIILQNYNFVL